MSVIKSLTTLDLPTNRYGRFNVSMLLEKLPEKVLMHVLKEYQRGKPTIDQFIEMMQNEFKVTQYLRGCPSIRTRVVLK